MLHAMVNIDKYNALPKAYKAVLEAASQTANTHMMAKYDAGNPAALRRLIAGGAKLQPFSQQVMEACLKAANEVYAETSAKNAEFKKIHDSYMAFRNDQYLWWQVAEYAFDGFQIRSRRG